MWGVNGPHFNLIAFLVIQIVKVINFFIYLEVSLYQYNGSQAAADKVEKICL